jgi:hypothetical protein
MTSPEFTALWTDHRVAPCATAVYDLRHPLVGSLTVTQQTLRSIDTPDQTLVTCTAPADSASAAALTMLAQLIAATPISASRATREAAERPGADGLAPAGADG